MPPAKKSAAGTRRAAKPAASRSAAKPAATRRAAKPAAKPAAKAAAKPAAAKRITRKDVEAATARFEKALNEAGTALQSLGQDLSKGTQASYKDIAKMLKALQANAKKTNREALKDLEQLAAAVTQSVPAARKASARKPAAAAKPTKARKPAAKPAAVKPAAKRPAARKRTTARSN